MKARVKNITVTIPVRKFAQRRKAQVAYWTSKKGIFVATPTALTLLALGAHSNDLTNFDDVFTAALRELPMSKETRKALNDLQVAKHNPFFWDNLDDIWRNAKTTEEAVERLNAHVLVEHNAPSPFVRFQLATEVEL